MIYFDLVESRLRFSWANQTIDFPIESFRIDVELDETKFSGIAGERNESWHEECRNEEK